MIEVALRCQADCGSVETVNINNADDSRATVASFLPEGWGWDWVNPTAQELHCPAHRPELPAPQKAIGEEEPSPGIGAQRVSRLG
jgi:membrane-bound lytic murein transglycosylase B